MSLVTEINSFFFKYGDLYDLKTINYTKQVVHKIMTSPVLDNFLRINKITATVLLNEMAPYSQFRLKQYGNEIIDMQEVQALLNVILFSNEIEKFILEDHVKFSAIGPMGEIYYKADQHASDYFKDKYDIDIDVDTDFDFTVLEGHGNNPEMGFGIN